MRISILCRKIKTRRATNTKKQKEADTKVKAGNENEEKDESNTFVPQNKQKWNYPNKDVHQGKCKEDQTTEQRTPFDNEIT